EPLRSHDPVSQEHQRDQCTRQFLQHAIKEGATKTVLYTDLANALVKLDRASEAVQVLRQAADRDPFNAELRKRLIIQLIQIEDHVNAQAQMEDYVQRFP